MNKVNKQIKRRCDPICCTPKYLFNVYIATQNWHISGKVLTGCQRHFILFYSAGLPCNTEQLPSDRAGGRLWSKLCHWSQSKSAEVCPGYRENTHVPLGACVRGSVLLHTQPFMITSTELHSVFTLRQKYDGCSVILKYLQIFCFPLYFI